MMNKKFISNSAILSFLLLSFFSCLICHSQINRVVFHDDFENSGNSATIWLPSSNYTFTTGFSGNGLLFNNTETASRLVSTPISLDNLLENTIAISASIKGENLTGGVNNGMVVQLVATTSANNTRYFRIPVVTSTFDWKQVGKILKIDSDVIAIRLEIGIFNASGKLWIDNIHVQVVAEPMPPARDPSIVINKTHVGMYRGMNVRSNSILNSDLDELSYNWSANTIRCQIGGDQFGNGLLRPDFDAILQSELTRMDTLVNWCETNGLHMVVGLAGLSQGLFSSLAAQTRLIQTWSLIADRYKNVNAVWAYDLANEPVGSYEYPYDYSWPLDNTILLWPSLAESMVNAIRSIDADKSIIIESLNYGISLDDIKPIDFSIPNIIYSVHMYVPHQFTHQTLPGYINSYSYPGIIDGAYYDKEVLRQLLQPLKDYQEKYRVPIYIGEFSAIRWTPNNSTFNYLRDCIELFEEYNWDWTFHAFREWNGWSVEHSTGYYDPILPTTMTDRELLLRSYFQQNLGQDQFINNDIHTSVCYPNPVKNELNFTLKNLEFDSGILEIYDIQGKLLKQKSITREEIVIIDVSNFSDGFYTYSLEDGNGKIISRGKFIKNKF
ncbi:cellulase family glycosylhydrolase [Flavobacterium sp.]|uniref:cellulase family glycosylhydrolase n=1 Tax=Flavobacterium sp. TaxID=239 RepID=UPI00286CEBEB|nr:cellulase family glycosylhydrolase [Flavobacterium sp.]